LWQGGDLVPYQPEIKPKFMAFASTRSNNANPRQAGPSITVFCVSGHVHMFPDDTATTTNSTRYLPGDTVGDTAHTGGFIAPANLLAHQNRVVLFPLLVGGAGLHTVTANNEAFYWTAPNDARNIDPGLDVADVDEDGIPYGPVYHHFLNQVVGWENPTGYGVMASLTADELFMVKCRGGAVVIRGDLNNYDSVTTLPYVRGTGMNMCNGCRSPLGFLYPVDSSGVWVWNGGEVSNHLTKHMEANFWRPPAESPARLSEGQSRIHNPWGDSSTQCSDWDEWVLWPANWLMDTDAPRPGHDYIPFSTDGSWWKIDDDSDHIVHFWAVDWRGRKAYGAPSGYRNQGDPALYEYSMADKATSFMWRSQPIPGTVDQAMAVQQIGLCASGRGTVRLTCRSNSDPAGSSMEITVDDIEMPHAALSSCRVQGTHIVFDVESVAVNDQTPAPTVHSIKWLPVSNTPITPSQA
jgi:hypothetical protein